MSKQGKAKRTARMTASQCVTAGVSGAAMVGVGLLLATPPGAPAPTTATTAAQLASFGSALAPAPLAPADDLWWLGDNGGSLFGASVTPNALAAAAGFNIFNPIGTGGWLIGDGVDAVAGCVGDACNGGHAGILFGNGGDGADGGRGGDGRFFFGRGGNGGQGVTGDEGDSEGETGHEGGQGGAGGTGGFFFGAGGAGSADQIGSPGSIGQPGESDGDGGAGGDGGPAA